MNEVEKTRETYRQIAPAYAQAHQQHDHMAAQIERFVTLVKPGGVVFDVGCGPGLETAVLQQHQLTAIGLDFTYEMMKIGRNTYGRQVLLAQADMRRLPLGTVAYGLWVCASLLHLRRKEVLPTLHEFHRVLKPGGVLYLSVKLGFGEEWVPSSYGQPFPRFFTFWQPETLDPLLETAVFDIIDGWQELGRKDIWLVRYARKKGATV